MRNFYGSVAFAILLSLMASPLKSEERPASGGRTTRQVTENFDVDPHWEGRGNRVKVDQPIVVEQDFGYCQTNHAGGKGAGEIGGRVQRSTKAAFYGKRLARRRTFEESLRCSGTFSLTQTAGMTSLYFGWFNTKTMEVRPRNWLGMYINGEQGGGEIAFGYNTATGRSDGVRATGVGPRGAAVRDFNQIPNDGTPYTFDLAYDPQANGGQGQITFTLGGAGPFTGGPFTFNLPADHRQAGASFDAFGIVNQQSAGNGLTIYFDDLRIDGELETFDRDPDWLGQGNRDQHEDYDLEGAHQFGYSPTAFAGREPGEIGGRIYSSDRSPGYYGDDVGRLTLDDRLVASGRVTIKVYGHDGGLYLGWFNSRKRGFPPENLLGALLDGTTSSGPRLRGLAAPADAKRSHLQWETAPAIPTDGASHTWKIEYEPEQEQGRGRLTVWVDGREDSVALPAGLREEGATFDRFGLAVHENGGRVSQVFFDDVEYTTARDPDETRVRVLDGHESSVMSIAFAPDGRQMATSSRDGTIKIWEVSSGKLQRSLTNNTGDVYALAYSPQGELLASGGKDGVVRLWDPRTGRELGALKGHTDIIRALAFSPDGKTLATTSVDLTVRLWSVPAGQLQRTLNGHTARVKSVVYGANGDWIATAASDKTIRVWDTGAGEQKATLLGHTSDIETLALSPDGKLLASSSNDTTVRLWDMTTFKPAGILEGHTAEVDSVVFFPDGKSLASGGKDTLIKFWEVPSGQLSRTLTGHTGRVESLAISPDGKTMASGGGGGDTSVRLWSLADE